MKTHPFSEPKKGIASHDLEATSQQNQGSDSSSLSDRIAEAIHLVRGKAGAVKPEVEQQKEGGKCNNTGPSSPMIEQTVIATETQPETKTDVPSGNDFLAGHLPQQSEETTETHPSAKGQINSEKITAEDNWSVLADISSDFEMTCSIGDLIMGLQAVCPSATLSEDRVVYLRAEPGSLLVFSFWEGEVCVYRLPAEGAIKGMISIPSWQAVRLLEQLKLQKKTELKKRRTTTQAFDSRPIDLSTRQNRTRVDAHAILTVTLRVPTWTHQIKDGGRASTEAFERLKRVNAYGWGDEQPAEASNHVILDAVALRAVCSPVVTAAQQHSTHTGRMQHDSNYYGILFRFEIDEQGNQRLTSVAADGTRVAAMQWHSSVISVIQGTRPIAGTVILPSWAVKDMLALLPTKGKVILIQNKERVALSTHRWILETVSVPGPAEIPSFNGSPPYAKVTASRSLLQRALSTISHKFQEGNVPDGSRCVTLETHPERGILRVVVPQLTSSIQPIPEQEIPLLEFDGPACVITVSATALEQGLSPIMRSVELTWWAPPALYPLLVRPRVPTGYVYGLQPTPRLMPHLAQRAKGETLRVSTGQIQLGDLSIYGVEELSTKERPGVYHTVLTKEGSATACSCGETAPNTCSHMHKVEDFLLKNKK